MPNWGLLKEQGRVKDVGIPWSAEELIARYTHMIPAPYVRRGALTIEAYEAMKAEDEAHLKAEGELPLEAMHRNELVTKATELGIEVTSQASEEALRTAITSKDSTPEVKLENVDEVPADEPADEALAAPKVAKKKKK